jgi:integrase
VQAFLDGFSDRPAQQKCAQTALKSLEKWAIVRDKLPYPITLGTEAPGGTGGHVPWTDEHVALAELHAKPHLARIVTLAANTGQRGSDLVRMGPTDLEDYQGRPGINVTQRKTGLKIWIPLTQEMMAVMRTWERRPGPFVLKEDGQPFSRPQLSDQWLRERDSNAALAPLADRGPLDARASSHGRGEAPEGWSDHAANRQHGGDERADGEAICSVLGTARERACGSHPPRPNTPRTRRATIAQNHQVTC